MNRLGNELSAWEQAFVDEYLVDLHQKNAVIRAGAKAGRKHKHPEVIGCKLYDRPNVRAAIEAAMAKRSERTGITQDYVLNGIVEIIERCKQAEPVLDKEGKETGEYRFDAANALRGKELLGKHLGTFTDKHEVKIKTEYSELSDEELKLVIATGILPKKKSDA